jgi:DnaJ-class molecular chaperone
MVEYCSKCNGNKKYRGMGHMLVTCDVCNGRGIESKKEPEKENVIEIKSRRGRPRKDITNG